MNRSSGIVTVLYLIDTYVSPPGSAQKGGAEKQLALLAGGLDSERFRPIVVQLSPFSSIPLDSGGIGNAQVIHLPVRRIYASEGLRALRKLIWIARQENVKVIQTFFEKSEIMGWLVSMLANIPIWITSRRDLGFKRKRLYRLIYYLSRSHCACSVANCEGVKQETINRERFPAERVKVIHNGMDFSLYANSVDGSDIRNELGIPIDAPVVGMIANMNFEIKGHHYFLEAARRIVVNFPKTHFILVGDGMLRNQLEQVARDFEIKPSVLFLGKRGDIPRILAAIDVSVLCSTSEGLSNVIMESMAAGKPVVATLVGGNPELVEDGKTGLLVPVADSESLSTAVMQLIADPVRAKSMGAAGRLEIQQSYSVHSMIVAYEQLYCDLMAAHA